MFFIVLDLRLTKVGVTAVTLFLFLLFLLSEQESISLYQFTDQQERVECHKTVADDSGNIVALGVVLSFDEYLIPQRRELDVVLLELF